MSQLTNAAVPVRQDVIDIEQKFIRQLAAPGPSLNGKERLAVATAARHGSMGDNELHGLANHLYASPSTVTEEHVRAAADSGGEPQTIEVIGIVSRLSAIDRIHQVLDVDLEPLPQSLPGVPTGKIAEDLKRRRCHVPMPPGPIPVA
ncbi:MAG: hypothetical protein U9N56_06440, partial [Actinomycetota bacterium]|nr:hypothetical protein [Actinomycetota bacterium]